MPLFYSHRVHCVAVQKEERTERNRNSDRIPSDAQFANKRSRANGISEQCLKDESRKIWMMDIGEISRREEGT